MKYFAKLFGKKGSTSAVAPTGASINSTISTQPSSNASNPGSTSQAQPVFCFLCCSNPMVIEALHQELTSNAPTLLAALGLRTNKVERYTVSAATVDRIRREKHTLFPGTCYLGSKSEIVEKMDALLIWLQEGSHVLFVSLPHEMLAKLLAIYQETLSQATRQMILPFPLFVTSIGSAQQAMLDALSGKQEFAASLSLPATRSRAERE